MDRNEYLENYLKAIGKPASVYNVDTLSKEEFAKIRNNGFGGSDSSKLLGCNPFCSTDELINEKVNFVFDVDTSKKASVRKGAELEPNILTKTENLFNEAFGEGCSIYKPTTMFKDDSSALTMNFDGVLFMRDSIIAPVEAKLVTKYGKKHYDFSKATYSTVNGVWDKYKEIEQPTTLIDPVQLADYYGIPEYYYTQVQQEIYFLNTTYGYLAVLDDDNWDLHIYKIHRNDYVIDNLVFNSNKYWALVEAKRACKNIK